MIPQRIARIPVHPEVMEEVVPLEDPVILDHPVILLRDERMEDGRRHLGVVPGPERVADVVEERARDVLLVLSGLEGDRGREA